MSTDHGHIDDERNHRDGDQDEGEESAGVAMDTDQEKGISQIELLFDCQRPAVQQRNVVSLQAEIVDRLPQVEVDEIGLRKKTSA